MRIRITLVSTSSSGVRNHPLLLATTVKSDIHYTPINSSLILYIDDGVAKTCGMNDKMPATKKKIYAQ